jgi:hypothetical protein
MKFIFETVNIEQKLYIKLITKFLISTLGKNRKLLDLWEITFKPSTMASNDPFFPGVDGVGGITGMGKITLYVEDAKTPFLDIFQRVYRRNALMITHEVSHAILIQMGRSDRVRLRNDDYSGHKAGTSLVYSTAEVHDRHMEKRFFILSFLKIFLFIPYRMRAQVLDFRELKT